MPLPDLSGTRTKNRTLFSLVRRVCVQTGLVKKPFKKGVRVAEVNIFHSYSTPDDDVASISAETHFRTEHRAGARSEEYDAPNDAIAENFRLSFPKIHEQLHYRSRFRIGKVLFDTVKNVFSLVGDNF